MSHEDPGNITYSEIGGLNEQIRELREVGIAFHYSVMLRHSIIAQGIWILY